MHLFSVHKSSINFYEEKLGNLLNTQPTIFQIFSAFVLILRK